MQNFVYFFLLFSFIQCEEIAYKHTNKENNLYFVLTTFRHGARNNFLPIDDFGNKILNLGKLTKYGEKQHLEIGKKYRNRYSSFLNMSYDKNQIYIRSSNVNRVIVSTEKELEGFFNKKIDSNDFDLINAGLTTFNLYSLNDEIRKEMKKYEKFCDKRKLNDIDYRKKFKVEIAPILKDCFNIKLTISLHLFCDDTFSAYYEYAYGNDINNKIGKCGKEKAKRLYEFCYDWYNSFRGWDEYNAYMFYSFYQSIFNYMNKAINGTGPVKMVMIGGHESNLDKFMDFLDGLKIVKRTMYPHYAFNIIIELRKYSNDYYLEIYYNDTLKYNNTLKTFQNILNNSKYSNLYNYCGNPPWKKYDIKNYTEEYNDSNNPLINETIINTNNEIEESRKYDIENYDINATEQNLIYESDIIINKNQKDDNETIDFLPENKTMNIKNNNGTLVKPKISFLKICNKYSKLYIIIGGLVLITIFIILVFALVYKYRKRKNKFMNLSEENKSRGNINISIISSSTK